MSSELVKELRNPDFRGSMQHLRSAGEIDNLFQQSAARIEALEAESARLREALDPFAGIAELVDLETEGFADTDTLELMFNDFLFDRFTLAHFRAARRAREGGNADATA